MRHTAFLIPTLDRIGGAERQVILLAQGLARRGGRVSVVALSGSGGDAARQLQSDGVEFHSLRMRKGLADPRGWMELRRWLRRERPKVLHAHLPHAVWMARWSALLARVPMAVVDTIHTAGTGTVGRWLGYRASNWLSDATTAVSRGAADAWLAAGMISGRRLTVIPNGIDTERWRADTGVRAKVRRELGVGNEFLWMASGRLEPVKDFATLLTAFALLPAATRLVIAGGGSLERELRLLAESLNMSGRVRFLGYVDDVLPYLQAADGFVLASLWEGLPMSLLEAAACGVPAVSTRVAGAEEILGAERLTVVGDVDSLCGAMSSLMRLTMEERGRIGAAARRRVVENYSLDAVLDRWEGLYGELLLRKRGVSRDG